MTVLTVVGLSLAAGEARRRGKATRAGPGGTAKRFTTRGGSDTRGDIVRRPIVERENWTVTFPTWCRTRGGGSRLPAAAAERPLAVCSLYLHLVRSVPHN